MIKIQIPHTILQPQYQVFQLQTRENCGNHSNAFGFCINLSVFQTPKKKKNYPKRNCRKNHIILYHIKVGLRRPGCTIWLHQIAEILLNF